MPLRGGEAEPFVGALGQPAIKRRIFLSLGVALLGLLTTPLLGNSSHERTEFEVDIRDGAEGLERMFRLALNRVEGMLGDLGGEGFQNHRTTRPQHQISECQRRRLPLGDPRSESGKAGP